MWGTSGSQWRWVDMIMMMVVMMSRREDRLLSSQVPWGLGLSSVCKGTCMYLRSTGSFFHGPLQGTQPWYWHDARHPVIMHLSVSSRKKCCHDLGSKAAAELLLCLLMFTAPPHTSSAYSSYSRTHAHNSWLIACRHPKSQVPLTHSYLPTTRPTHIYNKFART
jgi:hypothetical protein